MNEAFRRYRPKTLARTYGERPMRGPSWRWAVQAIIASVVASVVAVVTVVGFLEWQSDGFLMDVLANQEQVRLGRQVEDLNARFGDVLGAVSGLTSTVDNLQRVGRIKATKRLVVTAYSPEIRQTDSDPWINAAVKRVRPGTIAVSRDLFQAGWVFGKYVYVEGIGILRIEDLMHSRWTDRADIFYLRTRDAKRFGKRELTVALLDL